LSDLGKVRYKRPARDAVSAGDFSDNYICACTVRPYDCASKDLGKGFVLRHEVRSVVASKLFDGVAQSV
jgi:hypothetical protein